MLLKTIRKWLVARKRKRKKLSKEPTTKKSASNSSEMSTLGKPLERLPTMFVKDCGYIPVILTNAASIIERNIKAKELFQTQGAASRVNSSLTQLNAPRTARCKTTNVHDVIEAMKTFLVRLPEPLLSDDVCDGLIKASQEESVDNCINILSDFRKSSPNNFAIVHFMMKLLKKVSQYAEHNCMDVRKLATVFVLDVIKPLKLEDSNDGLFLTERMHRLPYLIMVIENLINNVNIFKSVCQLKVQAASPRGSPSAKSLPRSACTPARGSKSLTEGIGVNVSSKKSPKPVRNHDSNYTQLRTLQNESLIIAKPSARSTLFRTTSDAVDVPRVNGDKKGVMASPNKLTVCEKEGGPTALEVEKGAENVKQDDRKSPLEHKEAGTQAVRPFKCSQKAKKMSSAGTATAKVKKFIHAVDSSFKPSSPKRRRALSKSKGESSQIVQTTSIRLADKKSVQQLKVKKRTRKARSLSKKSLSENGSGYSRSHSRNSDYSVFHPDEEIAPWTETAANSDDNSLMNKTIRNPRVLAVVPSNKKTSPVNTKIPRNRALIESACKTNPQLFIMNYGFRTISQMNKTSPRVYNDFSSSSSESLEPQAAIKGVKRPIEKGVTRVSQSIQSINSEVAPTICKELLKGVKVKDGIGVNTTPNPFKTLPNLNLKILKPRSQIPHQGSECRECINKQRSPGNVSSTTGKGIPGRVFLPNTTRGTSDAPRPSAMLEKTPVPDTSLTGPSGKREFEQTIKRAGRGNISACRELECDCCPLGLNSSPQQRVTVTLKHGRPYHPQSNRQHPTQPYPLNCQELTVPRSSLGEWLVDIFLVCITLFCTCFVFYVHQQSSTQDDFHPD